MPEPDSAALRAQLEAIFDDPALDAFCLDYFSTVYGKFARGLRRDEKITLLLDHCRQRPDERQRLLDLLVQVRDGVLPPSSRDEATLQNYLTWVIDQHRYLDPRGTMQTTRQVQVLLQDVYVSLTAEEEPALNAADRHLYEHELEVLLARDDLRPEEREDLRENLLTRYRLAEKARPRREPVDLTDLARDQTRLIILGDPGAGKTTLLRYLALRHAQALHAGESEVQDLGPARLPLYLRIADYAEYGNGRSLLDYLPACICGENHADETLARLIQGRLAQGNCLVLLDGLDEVIAPDQRAEIAMQIDTFIRTHERTGNRFVVTSRVAGYRSAPLAGDVAHYRVCDMSDEQIRRFLDQWCHAVERFQTPDLSPEAQAEKAQREIDGITQAIEASPGVRALATNPLLLRTLALIHRTGARLPHRRVELYRLAADTLIRDWQLARGVPETALVREAEATRLLAEVAAWLHQEKPAGIATEGEVRAVLAEVKGRLDGREPEHPDVLNAVDDFLGRIRQYTGLFVERAPRRYGFMHLTFQEYFAARWLVARPRQAARRIRAKLHRSRWQEPILLAIGFYGMEFPDDVGDLIEEAILGRNLGGSSPYEDILHRDLLFAVRCLGDQDVSAGLHRRLVDDFVRLWLDPMGAREYQSLWERMGQIVQALRGSPAEISVRASLIAALRDDRESIRILATDALGHVSLNTEAVSVLLEALQDSNEHIRARTAYALRGAVFRLEVFSALIATLRDKDRSVRANAADALCNATLTAEAIPALLEAFRADIESGRRLAFVYSLRNATLTIEAVAVLLEALQDPSEHIRTSAASALRNVALTAEIVFILLEGLQDKSEYFRASVASALGNATAQPKVVPALLKALQIDSERVRASAARALGNAIAQPKVVPALLKALQVDSERVRASAAGALGNATAQPKVVPALLAALHDNSEDVRASAAGALGNATAQPKVVPALLAALHDNSEDVRTSAAEALGNATAQPKVVPALLKALQVDSERVRASAAGALRNTYLTAKTIAILLEAIHGESELVAENAVFTLSSATTAQPEVISGLLAALQNEDDNIRYRAAWALSEAPAQPEVITALLTALQDRDDSVRFGAANALAMLACQPNKAIFPDLASQFVTVIDLPGSDKWSAFEPSTRSRLVEILAAVAPGPEVDEEEG